VRDRPEGVEDGAVRQALRAWGIDGVGLAYAPVDLLAGLHLLSPPAGIPVTGVDLTGREELEQALAQVDRPWRGGPYSEPARALLAAHAVGLHRGLAEFDRAAARIGGGRQDGEPGPAGRELVVTHGEPHPGNLLRLPDGYLLVDWETVGLAVPERDLWPAAEQPADLARYAAATGRTPDPAALAFYRLRWYLADVAAFAGQFRSPHGESADEGRSWEGLAWTVKRLARR
jgi:spectinomycin phosphotransferase